MRTFIHGSPRICLFAYLSTYVGSSDPSILVVNTIQYLAHYLPVILSEQTRCPSSSNDQDHNSASRRLLFPQGKNIDSANHVVCPVAMFTGTARLQINSLLNHFWLQPRDI